MPGSPPAPFGGPMPMASGGPPRPSPVRRATGAAPPPAMAKSAAPPPPSPGPAASPPRDPEAAPPPSEAAPPSSAATPTPSGSERAGGSASATDGRGAGQPIDYTRIPRELDKKFEAFDVDGALRPTIINPGDVWTRTAAKGLLAAPTTATMQVKDQKDEKHRAFDLLDALSRSGALPIDHATLHVVVAATHCFDKTLLDTVIQGNVNPIEKVERSVMLVATTVHDRDASELLLEDQRGRFFTYTPQLAPSKSGEPTGAHD
jgi:hypothetical protein